MKGLPVTPKQISPPAPVHDLMSALKRSLAQETGAAAKPKRKGAAYCRQTNLLLPVSGKKKESSKARDRHSPPPPTPESVIGASLSQRLPHRPPPTSCSGALSRLVPGPKRETPRFSKNRYHIGL